MVTPSPEGREPGCRAVGAPSPLLHSTSLPAWPVGWQGGQAALPFVVVLGAAGLALFTPPSMYSLTLGHLH